MTYTESELLNAQRLAMRLELEGWELFCSLPLQALQASCNGIGSDACPEMLRRLLDGRHPTLRIAAMIHDVQFDHGNGTDSDFYQANAALFRNGCRLARHRYGWYNPLRYIAMWDAAKLAGFCDAFGRGAYDEARRSWRRFGAVLER